MAKKVKLNLLPSSKMSNNREHDLIRLPRVARNYLKYGRHVVVLGKGEHIFRLGVKQAYTVDVKRLRQLIIDGELAPAKKPVSAFVSVSTWNKINKSEGNSIWVSEKEDSITIGADPEFCLVRQNGSVMRGDNVFSGPSGKKAQFGADGPSVEVRPPPSIDHLKVVQNISRILNAPPDAAKQYGWRGGATYRDPARTYWFGGHVHLGRPTLLDPEHAVICYQAIATTLDALVALPLVRFDAPNPQLRRNGCNLGYGKAGAYNTGNASASIRIPQGDNRFEYRVLSGLWLTHPTLAKIILGTVKCVAESAYSRIADKKYDYDWVAKGTVGNSLLSSLGISSIRETRAIINGSLLGEITTKRLAKIRKQLRDLDKYEEYKEEVEALLSLASTSPKTINSALSLDVKTNWERGNSFLTGVKTIKLQTALEAVKEK